MDLLYLAPQKQAAMVFDRKTTASRIASRLTSTAPLVLAFAALGG